MAVNEGKKNEINSRIEIENVQPENSDFQFQVVKTLLNHAILQK